MSLNVKVNLGQNLLPTAGGVSIANEIAALPKVAGDIIVATGANSVKRLPKGTAGQILQVKSDGSDIEYASVPWLSVTQVADAAALPNPGDANTLYRTADNGKLYRLAATPNTYAEVPASLALGELATNAFRGDLGKIVYDKHVNIPTSGGKSFTDAVATVSGDDARTKIKNLFAEGDLLIPVPTPSGFSWTDHPLVGKIFTDGKGNFRTSGFDIAAYKAVGGGVTMYMSSTGLDTNDGLSAAAPKKTLNSCLANANCDTVMLAAGIYPMQTMSYGLSGNMLTNRSLNLIGASSDVYVTAHSNTATWSLVAGKTYTYKSSVSTSNGQVFDSRYPDATTIFKKLTLVASIDDVEATPNSYFKDATYIYVHLYDSGVPSNTFLINGLAGVYAFDYASLTDTTLYLENLTLMAGRTALRCASSSGATVGFKAYAKNCVFGYSRVSSSDNNVYITGGSLVIFENCHARDSYSSDGFNYRTSATDAAIAPKVIEINCIGSDNGKGAVTGTNNGSTCHDGVKIIRVNTKAYGNAGPNIHDVSDGTEAWILGGIGFGSTCPEGANLGPVDFAFSSGDVKVWMDGCKGYSSAKSAYFGAATDVIAAKTRNCSFEVAPTIGELSSVTPY